jgi:hypothetical protein
MRQASTPVRSLHKLDSSGRSRHSPCALFTGVRGRGILRSSHRAWGTGIIITSERDSLERRRD